MKKTVSEEPIVSAELAGYSKHTREILLHVLKRVSYKRWDEHTKRMNDGSVVVEITKKEILLNTSIDAPHFPRIVTSVCESVKKSVVTVSGITFTDIVYTPYKGLTVTVTGVPEIVMGDVHPHLQLPLERKAASTLSPAAGGLYEFLLGNYNARKGAGEYVRFYVDLVELLIALKYLDAEDVRVKNLLLKYPYKAGETYYASDRQRLLRELKHLEDGLSTSEKHTLNAYATKYTRWSNFRSYVLDKTQEEVRALENCPIDFSFYPFVIPPHGKVIGVTFSVYSKSAAKKEQENVQLLFDFTDAENELFKIVVDKPFECPIHFDSPLNERTWNKMLEMADGSQSMVAWAHSRAIMARADNDVAWTYACLRDNYGLPKRKSQN